MKRNPATNVTHIIDAIQAYSDTATTRWLVQPFVKLHSDAPAVENSDEVMTTMSTSLT
jgi:nuclear cap-binding protein subunit 1